MVVVASPLSMQHLVERGKTGWLGIRIMCPSGVTCLPMDEKSNSAWWSRTKRTSSSHWKLTCSCHDIGEKLLNWHWTTITPSEQFLYGHKQFVTVLCNGFVCRHNGFYTITFSLVDQSFGILTQRSLAQNKG